MTEKCGFKRWTATRKMEVILQLMKGEPIDVLSREIGIPASEIEAWRQAVIKGAEAALKARVDDPLQAELDLAKKRIGELCHI